MFGQLNFLNKVVKKYFLLIFLIAVYVSCNNKPSEEKISSSEQPVQKIYDTVKSDSFYKIYSEEAFDEHPKHLTDEMVKYLIDSSYNKYVVMSVKHWDSLKTEEETKEENDKRQKFLEDSIKREYILNMRFLKKNLIFGEKLLEEDKYESYSLHVLLKNYNANEDSLKKAIAIKVAYEFSDFENIGSNKKLCMIFLYKKKSDFKIDGYRSWFLSGVKRKGEKVMVQTEDGPVIFYNY